MDNFDKDKNELSQDELDELNNESYDALSEFEQNDNDENNNLSEELSKKQIQKQNEIETVKSKISKILKASNIEIVDENFGDEYEEDDDESSRKSQQDYDTLKALFGDKDRNKKDELTLTIDDFDYTYVGRYLEEFDLMHIKNIKHIRLKNPLAKKLKKVLIAAGIIVIAGTATILGVVLNKKNPVVITSVSLSQTASTSKYYVGENFSYDGLFIDVGYSDGTKNIIPLKKEHINQIEGGRVEVLNDNIQFLGGSVLMTISYEGYTLTYAVNVENKEPQGVEVRYSNSIFNLNAGDYISGHLNGKSDLVILVDYGDYGISKIDSYTGVTLMLDSEICFYEQGRGWRVPKNTSRKAFTIKLNIGNSEFIKVISNN